MNEEQHDEQQYQVNERGRAVAPDVSDDEKTWSLIMHLTLLGHLVIPYLSIIAPIVMWMNKKDQSQYIDDHGREAVNFQITILIYSFVLPIAAALIGIITCGVGLLLVIPAALLPYVLGLVGMIMAAMAAGRGEFFRYPMTIRFLN